MPKVSVKRFQRRIAELDAQYTVAQPKRPDGFTVLRRGRAYRPRNRRRRRTSLRHRTTSDFVELTLKQGPAPAMWGEASPGLKRGE